MILMPRKNATQDDVAALAGVTRATVSYVLTGRAQTLKITPEVIERVEKSAKKLRYLPNLAARSLAAGQSRQIGLLIPGPEFVKNYYWGPILAGVENAALKLNYDILLLSSGNDAVEKMKNYLLQNRIDISISIGSAQKLVGKRFPVPPVTVGSKSNDSKLPSVYTEVGSAIRDVVENMRRLGVERVVWVGPKHTSMHMGASLDRQQWLMRYCEEAALPLEVWNLESSPAVERVRTTEAEIAYWDSLIAQSGFVPKRKLGFLCWNDLVALGLYKHLNSLNLMPGRDVAVVGFDNHFAEAALPPLASIGFNAEKMGEAAVEMAVSILEQRRTGKRLRQTPVAEVPARLLMRASLNLSV